MLWTSPTVSRRVITAHISTPSTSFPWTDTEMELSVALQFLAQKYPCRFPITNHSSFPVLNLMPQQRKVSHSCFSQNQTYTMFTDKQIISQTIFNLYQDLLSSGFKGTPMIVHSSSGSYKENEDVHGLKKVHYLQVYGARWTDPEVLMNPAKEFTKTTLHHLSSVRVNSGSPWVEVGQCDAHLQEG